MADELVPKAEVQHEDQDDGVGGLLSLMERRLRTSVEAVPQSILDMDEEALKEELFGEKPPSQLLHQLRFSFWKEFEFCQQKIQRTGQPAFLRARAIYTGVCSKGQFYDRILNDPPSVAWMVRPPVQYELANEELLDLAQRRTREILTLPIQDPVTGKVNAKLVDTIAKIRESLENRVKGAVLQKQANVNVNYDATGKPLPPGTPPPAPALPKSAEEVAERIKELAQEAGLQLPAAATRLPEPQPVKARTVLYAELVDDEEETKK